MWRSALGIAAGVCLWGQQTVQMRKPGPVQKSKEISPSPAKVRSAGEIQKVKDQCRSRLIIEADMLFESDKSDFTSGAERVLSDLGPMIRKEGIHPISVEGHTDNVGADEDNQTLSEQRARTVETWLESRGYVIATVTEVHGLGKAQPLAPNDTPQGRQKNRRVEIVINTCKS